MSQAELLTTWEGRIDWIGNGLMNDGVEGCVLQPIGQAPAAATKLVRHSFESGNYIHRKVSASLGGYIETAEPTLLQELFDAERTRDATLAADSLERLYCQSAVEDIVFS